ncbi:MAG: hypothetical protein Q4E74_02880 [Ruminococcus sp.]|nr:hypothetical protein [Ruminococcus sp.]
MKKVAFEISSKPEKIIAAATASVVMAILFDGKRKKNQRVKGKSQSFPQRVMKNYRIADNLLCKTVAKNAEKQAASDDEEYQTKLRDLKIEDAIPFDLQV